MTHDSDEIHKEGEQKPQPLQIDNPVFQNNAGMFFMVMVGFRVKTKTYIYKNHQGYYRL